VITRRRNIGRARSVFVITFGLIGCGVAYGAEPIVWVVPSTLVRIGPKDSPGSETRAMIYGGRGEYVDFQVGVHASEGGLTNLNFSTSKLTGPNGAEIASQNLIRYRESYITLAPGEHSSTDGEVPGLPYNSDNGVANVPITDVNAFPDGLIPFIDPETDEPPIRGAGVTEVAVPVRSVTAGENVVFWIDLLVPRDKPAGRYRGTYSVTSIEGNITGEINLMVWDFTLPLNPSLKSLFNGGSGGTWPEGLEAELVRNKLMPDSAQLATETDDIREYGLNTYDMGYYENVSYGACTGDALTPKPPSLKALQAAVNAQQEAYPGPSLADYTADPESSCTNEAFYKSVIAWAQVLHRTIVEGQNGVDNIVSQQPVAALFNDGLGTGRSAVDVWTMLPMNFDLAQLTKTDGLPNVTYVQRKGDKVWSYNDLVQDEYSPKWELDFLPINYRIQVGFLSQSLGLKGVNYWNVVNWDPPSGSDAWTGAASNGFDQIGYYFPDEGILVYPGRQAGLLGVAPSMRLKYLRDGVQDYEYIELLKQCGQKPSPAAMFSLSSSGKQSPNWHDWTMDYRQLESARLTFGRQIQCSCHQKRNEFEKGSGQ
jgi:Domain of unknown function (DUF4091)